MNTMEFKYELINDEIAVTRGIGPSGHLNIPDEFLDRPVTSIRSEAFSSFGNPASVSIPESVIRIEERAFADCMSLASITVDVANPAYSSLDGVLFNKSQTTLIQCPGGKTGSYRIPDGVTNIAAHAFEGCCDLTEVIIPASVIDIGSLPFSRCKMLTAIIVDTLNPAYCSIDGVLFDKSVTRLIRYAGNEEGVYLTPESVNCFAEGAFSGYRMTGIKIPDGVTYIPDNLFANCQGLETVTIPEGTTTIGGKAFYYCAGLRSLTIPGSVTHIGNSAFRDCWRLESIYFKGNAPSIAEHAFLEANDACLYYSSGSIGWDQNFSVRLPPMRIAPDGQNRTSHN